MRPPPPLARLLAVPPGEFTATRNRLAAELRKNGQADAARALATLRKPSAPLWAVNRLAATEAKGVTALIDAVAQLRRSQLRDPRAAAEAVRAQRAALETLVARGRDVLAGAGLTATQQTLRRLSDTLMGAAADRQHADALRRGELTQELAAPGFEAFSGARVPAPRLRLVRGGRAPTATKQREAIAARATETEDLARRAAEHDRGVSDLEAEASSARARVAELDRRLREARRAARATAAAAKRARRKAKAT